MVADPAETPVTKPFASIVATDYNINSPLVVTAVKTNVAAIIAPIVATKCKINVPIVITAVTQMWQQ